MTTERLARAKINLSLHVTGQRSDGYHLLDSLVCFADFGDLLRVETARDLTLSVSGPFTGGIPAGPDNLVLKAAALFSQGRGASIDLEKNLPPASGVGGGSSDAAAVLHLLADHWGQALPERSALLALGADVPVCVLGKPVRMRGVGEELIPVRLPAFAAVLVNPGVAVSTPEVFRNLVSKENAPLDPLPETDDPGLWIDYLSRQRNDLEAPACSLAPEVSEVLSALMACEEARLARMSGSGATCFGLFDDMAAAKEVAARIALDHPGWWVKACRFGC